MKVMAFNGSPRKKWNTATLLEKALEGASSKGAETELIHLYDLNYKGCISCFSCKMKNHPATVIASTALDVSRRPSKTQLVRPLRFVRHLADSGLTFTKAWRAPLC